MTDEQRERKRARERERTRNLSPEQRERQRARKRLWYARRIYGPEWGDAFVAILQLEDALAEFKKTPRKAE